MISIITIVYNDLEGIRRTYESLSELEDPNIEWIIVDNLSTDGTSEFVSSINCKRLKHVREADDGIYDAMNVGLNSASGEYLIYINSGDELVPSGLFAFLRLAEETRSGVDLFFMESVRVREDGFSTVVSPKPFWYIYYSLPAIHQSIIYRRTAALAEQYDSTYRVCGDYDFTARLIKNGSRCMAIRIPVSKFHLGGVSTQKPYDLADEAMRVQRQTLNVPNILARFLRRLRLLRMKCMTS